VASANRKGSGPSPTTLFSSDSLTNPRTLPGLCRTSEDLVTQAYTGYHKLKGPYLLNMALLQGGDCSFQPNQSLFEHSDLYKVPNLYSLHRISTLWHWSWGIIHTCSSVRISCTCPRDGLVPFHTCSRLALLAAKHLPSL